MVFYHFYSAILTHKGSILWFYAFITKQQQPHPFPRDSPNTDLLLSSLAWAYFEYCNNAPPVNCGASYAGEFGNCCSQEVGPAKLQDKQC